jgi:DNA-binding MurR/RpiR family transcriptional regulator
MFQDLKDRIVNSKLTKKESMIADYILNNGNKVCFMTATDIAATLETSDASVIRMAKALGYSGFNDMQKDIQDNVSKQVDVTINSLLSPIDKLTQSELKGVNNENLFNNFIDLSVNNLKSIIEKNNEEKFDNVVNILLNSKHKYICGFRSCASIARQFGFLLRLIISGITFNTEADSNAIENVIDINENDCIFMISFNRYSKMATTALNIAKKNGAKIIVLTDKATSPVACYADELLIIDVDSLSYFNSNIATMFLLEFICTKLALKLGKKTKERLTTFEPFINDHRVY